MHVVFTHHFEDGEQKRNITATQDPEGPNPTIPCRLTTERHSIIIFNTCLYIFLCVVM